MMSPVSYTADAQPEPPIKLGVSACLLGEKVRYDGGHKQDPYLLEILARFFSWVPVCPEVEVGMGVPREAVRLVGDPQQPRMIGTKSGEDWTARMRAYAEKRLDALAREKLCGFVFKSKSPSSGLFRVKVYTPQGTSAGIGAGLFAGAFHARFPLIPVEEEGRLNDPGLRENFIERVFGYHRLQRMFAGKYARGAVVAFHSRQKLLLMAHSPRHYQALGRRVAQMKDQTPAEFAQGYIETYLEALAKPATPARHENVLLHIMGYFKNQLSADEKQELLRVIADYRQQQVPLVVPLTLLMHYIRKFDVEWLAQQVYLQPHPKELMLRNHV